MSPLQISGECIGAEDLGMPEAHARCAGNGPVYLPEIAVGPVLPRVRCDCCCHADCGCFGEVPDAS